MCIFIKTGLKTWTICGTLVDRLWDFSGLFVGFKWTFCGRIAFFLSPSFYQALPDPTPSVGAKTPYALAFFYTQKLE